MDVTFVPDGVYEKGMLPEPDRDVTVALAAGELSVCAATRLEHARKAAVMVMKIVAPLLGDRR